MAEPTECEENIFKMLKEGEDYAIFSEFEDMREVMEKMSPREIESISIEATVAAKKDRKSPLHFISHLCGRMVSTIESVDYNKCKELVCEAAANWVEGEKAADYWKKRWEEK